MGLCSLIIFKFLSIKYPKRSSSELAVIAKVKDLAGYVFEATRKSPKVFRFTFVLRMASNTKHRRISNRLSS